MKPVGNSKRFLIFLLVITLGNSLSALAKSGHGEGATGQVVARLEHGTKRNHPLRKVLNISNHLPVLAFSSFLRLPDVVEIASGGAVIAREYALEAKSIYFSFTLDSVRHAYRLPPDTQDGMYNFSVGAHRFMVNVASSAKQPVTMERLLDGIPQEPLSELNPEPIDWLKFKQAYQLTTTRPE